MEKDIELLETTRKELIDEHVLLDSDGKMVQTAQGGIEFKDPDAFQSAWTEFLELDDEYRIYPVKFTDIPDKFELEPAYLKALLDCGIVIDEADEDEDEADDEDKDPEK
jgi:hypothetical protein